MKKTAIVIILACLLSACGNPLELLSPSKEFVGCYATKEGGDPLLKIEHSAGEYHAAVKMGKTWDNVKSPMRPATEKELLVLFGKKEVSKISGSLMIENGTVGVFKINKGESVGTITHGSKYLMALFLLSGEAYQTTCR